MSTTRCLLVASNKPAEVISSMLSCRFGKKKALKINGIFWLQHADYSGFSPSRYSRFTTTEWVKLLMKRPSYSGLEAEPAMKSPPWIHTMTGSGFLTGKLKLTSRGTKTLR